METITFNLKPAVRHVTYHGKEYMVVPLTMLMPGVLNGSKGPLFYPEGEIARNSDAWNAIPIVVNHPTDPKTGEPVSARSPQVLADNEVGRVYYATAKRGLVAEGWFATEDTRRVSAQVYNALKLGQKIELSTGLFTENEPAPDGAVHNGKPYKHIARNYRPDHLAVLPYQKGACGISDGCGVGVLTNTTGGLSTDHGLHGDKTMDRDTVVNWLVTNCECWKEEGSKETLNALKDSQLTKLQADTEEAAEALRIAGEAKKGITLGHQEFKYDTTTNAFVVNGTPPTPSPKPVPSPTPAPNPAPTPSPNPTPTPTPTPGAVTNKDTTVSTPPITNETDWLAAAPESVRNTFLYAKSVEQRDKDALVARITANMAEESKPAMVEKLRVKSLSELNDWWLVSNQNNNTHQVVNPRPFYMPDTGYAPAAPVVNDENDILELPRMTYEPLVSKRKA